MVLFGIAVAPAAMRVGSSEHTYHSYDSAAALRAAEYVAAFIAGREDFELHLLHALRPLPPQAMKSPGSEDPSLEQQIERAPTLCSKTVGRAEPRRNWCRCSKMPDRKSRQR